MTRLRIDVVTLFPDVIRAFVGASIPARAAAKGLAEYRLLDLRDFTHDRHRTVDDYPYGGGAGMVLKPEPFFEAVDALRAEAPMGPVVLLSARGRRFEHPDAVRFSVGERLTLLCGHYKDVDERVASELATEELSVGDFVLSGGEPAAMCVIDAVVRLLPGALGDHESAAGVPGSRRARGAALGQPRRHRGVADGAGRAADARAPPRPLGAVRGRSIELGAGGRGGSHDGTAG